MLKEQEQTINNHLVIKTYLECPYCKTQYVVCYDDQSTLSLKKQIIKYIARIGTISEEHEYNRNMKIIKKKQNQLEKKVRLLQSNYAKYFETQEK